MASISFGNTIDLSGSATPSSGAHIIGYDLDGILKQKDEFGVITEIGGSTGGSGTSSLSDTLSVNNNTNTYSIIMGTSTSILSANGGSRLDLDYSGTNSILLSTDNGVQGEHGLLMENGYYVLYSNGYEQSIELDNGLGDISIYNSVGDIQLGVNNGGALSNNFDEIKISNNGSSTASTGDNDKQGVFIGTRNSVFSPGVVNSVIIGGDSIIGTNSNHVYIGGNLNINNSYTFPNLDGSNGQSLISDGNGNIYWGILSPGLSDVLLVDNNTGISDIIMGTSTSILSANGVGKISLDDGGSDSILISSTTSTYISLDNDITIDTNDVLNIGASAGNVVTTNLQGLVYGFDYSSTFINNSLVSKQYVDNGTSSLWSGLDNYLPLTGGTVSGNTEINAILSATSVGIGTNNPGVYVLDARGDVSIGKTSSNTLVTLNGPDVDITAPSANYINIRTGYRISLFTYTTPIAQFDNEQSLFYGDIVGNNNISCGSTVSTSGFKMTDGASDGYILQSDSIGNATWVNPITKHTEFALSLTASVTETITHNLGTQSIICQAWDTSTGEVAYLTFKNRQINSVDILSTTNLTVDVIIQS